MTKQSNIPEVFQLAFKWRRWLVYPMYGAALAVLLAFFFKNFWFGLGVIVAMPSAYLMNLRCYKCYWTACKQFGPGKFGQDAMLAPLVSPLLFPSSCTKCGAKFAATKEDNAQTH